MKNAEQLKLFTTLFVIALCAVITAAFIGSSFTVKAVAQKQDAVYCDGLYLGDTYDGQGEQVADYYDVYYDYYEVVENVAIVDAPSFKNGDANKKNYCAPLAGMNVVVYYDRWCTELIPNYDPGMTFANGTYHYYPDMFRVETKSAFNSIYSLMKTEEIGGTTSANFKSGLNTYVKNTGYSLSYTTMYKNSASVDLQKLTAAINQGKVGLVMCSEYNFISGINDITAESRVRVVKTNCSTAHMMMVYGYQTYAYYKGGANIRTDTYLYVCSSYGSGAKGFMLLDDFLKIDEALIMTIS